MNAGQIARRSSALISHEAVVATTRFGLGARPGELALVSPDPLGWLEGQLMPETAAPAAYDAVPPSPERLLLFFQAQGRGIDEVVRLFRKQYREGFLADTAIRARAQIETDQPFRERLVQFWSNHFTVSAVRPVVAGIAVPFEKEAIRPHVTAKFQDMLLAVARHPAMLLYLDNALSTGPTSPLGQRRGRGLNENLAREILELHTLGVTGGYDQDDVKSFARILTGWTVGNLRTRWVGHYMFVPQLHEPGEKMLLGRRFEESGAAEGEAALRMLARHPATARHIATKLARHFIADDPPEAAVQRLVRVFTESEGDLGALALTLVRSSEAWTMANGKIKSPNDYFLSALRLTGSAGAGGDKLVKTLAALGQPPLAAPSPAGWPDDARSWVGPESVMRRVEFALALAERTRLADEPMDLAEASLGPLLAADTRQAIERAGSRAEGLALLLAAPEFQRR
ncbi:MAG: DUF1800 domain-containing protein [Proteobacteria bacterium]|nr:DUF1800 domain-containing protein [Pseudomonadota bacterium]MBI3499479.1 DUF1800 domain-containing protein [Pseudomonadota bacterium]